MLCSVIICTFNRAPLLRRALEALEHQTLAPDTYEILVVNDGSTDHTATVCEEMRSRLSGLRCIAMPRNVGHAASCNEGVRVARGDYILFTDDDCVPDEHWVERMMSALDREPIITGAVESPRSPYIKLCHNIDQFHRYMPGRPRGHVPFIGGANIGFRRVVLEELGGFEAGRRLAFDTQIALRAQEAGYHVCFEPDAIVLHDPPAERCHFVEVLRYSASHAAATISLRIEHGNVLGTPFVLRSVPLLILSAPVIASVVVVRIFAGNPRLRTCLHAAPMVWLMKLSWCWGAAQGLLRLRRRAKDVA